MDKEKRRIKRNIAQYNRAQKNVRAVIECRKNNKIKLIKALGGKCEKCGYNKQCSGAYHFHHKNRNEKEFQIAKYMSRKFETLLKEAKKCMLLCSNCHAEIHDEEYNLIREDTIRRWELLSIKQIEEISKRKAKIRLTKNCINCNKPFDPNYKTQIFCCPNCRILYNKNLQPPENLEQLYKEMSIADISKQYIVSEYKIKKWLKDKGLYTNKICEACNNQFYADISTRRFCCGKCAAKGSHYRKVKNHPSKEELQKMINEMSWTEIGKKYGISCTAVRKWAKRYEIPIQKRKYVKE